VLIARRRSLTGSCGKYRALSAAVAMIAFVRVSGHLRDPAAQHPRGDIGEIGQPDPRHRRCERQGQRLAGHQCQRRDDGEAEAQEPVAERDREERDAEDRERCAPREQQHCLAGERERQTQLDPAGDERGDHATQPRQQRRGRDDEPDHAHPERRAVDLGRGPRFGDRCRRNRLLRLHRHRETEREPRKASWRVRT